MSIAIHTFAYVYTPHTRYSIDIVDRQFNNMRGYTIQQLIERPYEYWLNRYSRYIYTRKIWQKKRTLASFTIIQCAQRSDKEARNTEQSNSNIHYTKLHTYRANHTTINSQYISSSARRRYVGFAHILTGLKINSDTQNTKKKKHEDKK